MKKRKNFMSFVMGMAGLFFIGYLFPAKCHGIAVRTYIKLSDGANPASSNVNFTAYYNGDDNVIETEDSWNNTQDAGYFLWPGGGYCRAETIQVNPTDAVGNGDTYRIWVTDTGKQESNTATGTVTATDPTYTSPGGMGDWLELSNANYLAIPTGFSATGGNGFVELSWNQAWGASGYRIYRWPVVGNGNIVYERVQIISGGGTITWRDNSVANGTTYYYIIVAIDDSNSLRSGHTDDKEAIPGEEATPTATSTPIITNTPTPTPSTMLTPTLTPTPTSSPIATLTPSPTPIPEEYLFVYGIFGKNEIVIKNVAYVDSYDSRAGSWNYEGQYRNGDIYSNDFIRVHNNAGVYGDASVTTGNLQDISIGNNGFVTGDLIYDAEIWNPLSVTIPAGLDYTEEVNPGITGMPGKHGDYQIQNHNLVIHTNKTVTFAEGNYRFVSVELKNNSALNISGKVKIYVEDDFNLGNNSEINSGSYSGIPTNLLLYAKKASSDYGIQISNNAEFHGGLYAPDTGVELKNNHKFFGAVVAKKLKVWNKASIHYDEAFQSDEATRLLSSSYIPGEDIPSPSAGPTSRPMATSTPVSIYRPTPAPAPTTQWLVLESGDYNGDGSSDITVFRPSSGIWIVKDITICYYGIEGDIPASGDYNGDGTSDIAVFRPGIGLWAVQNITRCYFGTSRDIPVPADYDGDGFADIAIFRPSSGLWAIKDLSCIYWGTEGDIPVPSDYDGDWISEIAIFRPSSGLWAIRNITRFYLGKSGDYPIPGDYDGDGSWEAGLFRASNSFWYLRGITRFFYGTPSDIPVPADYDGDYTDDVGLFRPSNSRWYVRGMTRVYYGTSGDIPVTK